jgi:hypothetical protein
MDQLTKAQKDELAKLVSQATNSYIKDGEAQRIAIANLNKGYHWETAVKEVKIQLRGGY